MKENFSKRVQNILKSAKEEAIRLGHSYVGSEHLLLGLLRLDSGLSSKILEPNPESNRRRPSNKCSEPT